MRIAGQSKNVLTLADLRVNDQPSPFGAGTSRIKSLQVNVMAGDVVEMSMERYILDGEPCPEYAPNRGTFERYVKTDPTNGMRTLYSRHIVTALDVTTDETPWEGGGGPGILIETPKQPEAKPEEPPKPKEFPSPIPDLEI